MDQRALRQFLELAENLHFGRASQALHVSPSALSRSIRRLEDDVGATLFERNNRRVSLTAAGELFLAYAREALTEWEAMRNSLLQHAAELRGEISVYCSVTASYSFLFDILRRFRRSHPRVELKLHTGDPEDAIARVLSRAEDIAIGARPERMPAGLAFEPVADSPLVFIAGIGGAGDDAALEGEPDRERWSRIPMVLPERGLARARADGWFHELGVQPDIYAQVAGNEAIVSMVSLGFGVGIVPQIVLENSPLAGRVRVLDVRPRLQAYEVGLFTLERQLANPLIAAFWAQLR
jgi:LysR family positive regulator for ilvC